MRDIQWMTYGKTAIHPLALALTLIMGMAILALKKRSAMVVPILIVSFFITEYQRIVIASLDFNMTRLLLLFGWLRVILREEWRALRLNSTDRLVLLYGLSSIVFYTILWRSSAALINRLGFVFTLMGLFFLFRIAIRSFDDIVWVFKVLALMCIPIAAAMTIERLTQANIFAVFGGVPPITLMREGRLRSQGAFTHPILAGTFGATLLPLFAALWAENSGKRRLALFAVAMCLAITFFSASSGPVLSLVAGVLGIALWRVRGHMKAIKWGALGLVFALQIAMKAPVWALVSRVGVFGGSTGYHRFALLDNFIRRFGEWFLFGTRTTAHWGWGLQDVTNQYVRIGIDGGIVSLLLFFSIIWTSATAISRCMLRFDTKREKFVIWCLGSALFAHLVSFMGVSYFDQIVVSWYLLLAMISTAREVTIKETSIAAVSLQERDIIPV
jgi:hypothetical protein